MRDDWQAENEQLKRKLFGPSSEKQKNDDGEKASSPEDAKPAADEKRKRVKPENSGRGQVGEVANASPHQCAYPPSPSVAGG